MLLKLADDLRSVYLSVKRQRGILRVRIGDGILVVGAFILMVMGHLLSAFVKSFLVCGKKQHPDI